MNHAKMTLLKMSFLFLLAIATGSCYSPDGSTTSSDDVGGTTSGGTTSGGTTSGGTTSGGTTRPDGVRAISGLLDPAAYSLANSSSRNGRSIASAISHIASISVIAGSADISRMTLTPVAENGKFTLEVKPESGQSTLLLIVNRAATSLEAKAADFLSLRSDSYGSSLIAFPLDKAKGDIELGTIGGAGTSSTSLESQSGNFGASYATLLRASYHNILFRSAKNDYVNKDEITGTTWNVNYLNCFDNVPAVDCINRYSAPEASVKGYRGSITFNVNTRDFSYDDVMTGRALVKIYPPNPITLADGTTADSSTPLVSSSGKPQGTAGSAFNIDPLAPSGIRFALGMQAAPGILDGYWKITVNGTESAYFDISYANLFTSTGRFIYFLPSYRLSVDSTGLITALDIRWYSYNPETGDYAELADPEYIARMASILQPSLTAYAPLSTAEGVAADSTQTHYGTFKYAWYALRPSLVPAGGTALNTLFMGYVMGGTSINMGVSQGPLL